MNPNAGSDAAPAFEPVLTSTMAHVVPRQDHPISRADISDSAMKVLYRLIGAGHLAFLVGGGVRDLLLGKAPKDFDIATDASPEQVRELFRNSRLIGRRFRLAHVRFGREIIEVATFRGSAVDDDAPTVEQADLPSRRRSNSADEPAAAQSGSGMILRDNVYGTVDEDAARRDFTINALYYTPADFCLYDFAGGLDDMEARRIRLIGDPDQRYREDPVRMLRALRFAAKLDFEVDEDTAEPIPRMAELLLSIPPARLFDEVAKLFMHGHAERSFDLLREFGVFTMLFPQSNAAMDRDPSDEEVARCALASTDARVHDDRPVTPGFLLAALLWPALRETQARLIEEGVPPRDALFDAGAAVLAEQQQHTAIPRRFSTFIRETWELQPRLESVSTRRVASLLEHPRFRAAYDFLVIRERAGQDTGGMGDWWTRYQDADEDEQAHMREQLRGTGGGPEGRSSSDAPPRKRRRRGGRRRTPAGSD
ncbi:MAG TPA: polynucleotide adenylyltransferase PcnB [Pseudomonadales bacterium]|nr:polynucleotide adenylyltransferase PcnB [Pseudomonadales bacterium]